MFVGCVLCGACTPGEGCVVDEGSCGGLCHYLVFFYGKNYGGDPHSVICMYKILRMLQNTYNSDIN